MKQSEKLKLRIKKGFGIEISDVLPVNIHSNSNSSKWDIGKFFSWESMGNLLKAKRLGIVDFEVFVAHDHIVKKYKDNPDYKFENIYGV